MGIVVKGEEECSLICHLLPKEHDQMTKKFVWKAVKRLSISWWVKVMTLTWAMKKKSNGKFRA